MEVPPAEDERGESGLRLSHISRPLAAGLLNWRNLAGYRVESQPTCAT